MIGAMVRIGGNGLWPWGELIVIESDADLVEATELLEGQLPEMDPTIPPHWLEYNVQARNSIVCCVAALDVRRDFDFMKLKPAKGC